MTQWLVDNKDNLNIDFVMHVGDIVDLNTSPEWEIADEAMSILDGEIPYSLLPGNHDMGDNGSANVRDIFGDGTTQLVSYSDYDTPVYQILNNYQDGVAREITGNGNPELGDRGGNGAIRLVTIEPTENTITEETFFVTLDEYIINGREPLELNRDGLTGLYLGHNEKLSLKQCLIMGEMRSLLTIIKRLPKLLVIQLKRKKVRLAWNF